MGMYFQLYSMLKKSEGQKGNIIEKGRLSQQCSLGLGFSFFPPSLVKLKVLIVYIEEENDFASS